MGFTRGDHLKALRRGYGHHGIYVGEGKVLHYLDGRGVCECSLGEFADGMPTDTVPYLVFDTFSPEEVVRRAYSRMGENKYNLVFKNCEHFATWCMCGLEYSGQVQRAAAAMAGVGAFAARRVLVGAAGRAVLGGAVTAKAVGAGVATAKVGLAGAATAKVAGAGAAVKLGTVGLGAAGAVAAPFLLAAGAVLLMGVGLACLFDEN